MRILRLLVAVFLFQVLFIIAEAAPLRYPWNDPLIAVIHLPLDNETADITENMLGVDAPTRNVETTDYVPQSIANGVDLDGSNEDINTTFTVGTTDGFSICWWINTTQGSSGQAFLGTDIDVANPTFFLHESVGRMRVEMHDASAAQSVVRWVGAYDFNNGLNHSICLTKRQGDCAHDAWELYIDTVRREPTRDDNTCSANNSVGTIWMGSRESISWTDAAFDEMLVFNRLIDNATIATFHAGNYTTASGSVPLLYGFNCTSCGAPFGDNSSPYTTSDTTPTFRLFTNISANCRIDDAQLTYSQMGQAFDCSTTGGTTHTCTLNATNQLITSTDYVYVGCADVTDSNQSSTAELLMEITGLDATTADAIDLGIQNSTIWPGATVYRDQRVFLRNVAGQETAATVDRVAVYGNQRWIINHDNTSAIGLTFNITPVVYVLDLVNMSGEAIQTRVRDVINKTKS